MSRAGRWIVGWLCLSLGLAGSLAPPAAAQSMPAAGERPEVEKLVSEGIALRAAGKDLDALAALKRAAELDPRSVRVQVHLGNVYQALGEWVLADQHLRRALAHESHPYVQRHRQALEDARDVIADNLGTLQVEGEPAGAEVRLNGRLVGVLPLATPVPVTVGSYTLEVRREGHYTARRPLSIAGRDVVRESVRLERLPTDEAPPRRAAGAVSALHSDATLDRGSERAWLTWTLAGVGAAAGVTAIGAVVYREVHAKRWNDNSRCLEAERTRAQVCAGERDKVDMADGVALATGVAAGLLGVGAFVHAFASSSSEATAQSGAAPRAGLAGCSVGLGGASCFGSF